MPISAGPTDGQWLICETSGSSGGAKSIRRRPLTWIKSFEHTARAFKVSSQDTYAVFGSLGHSLSLFSTLEALHLGADLAVLSDLKPKRQIVALDKCGATVLYATPTQLKLLVKAGEVLGRSSILSVRHIFIGGGKLLQSVKDDVAALFPNADVKEFFGASETSFITMSDTSTPVGSVGRPYPGVTLRVGETPDGVQDGVGEIWVKSDYLFDGYADNKDHGTRWRDGYLSIGEMGYLGRDGSLFLRGRQDRMVTISDVNVFPEDIEAVIGALPDVQCCAVITIPDAERGHMAICIIQTTAADLTPSIIRKHCRSKLGSHAIPKAVYFVPEIPLLTAGKPDLQLLKSRFGDRA